jgi:hypothetical protein
MTVAIYVDTSKQRGAPRITARPSRMPMCR